MMLGNASTESASRWFGSWKQSRFLALTSEMFLRGYPRSKAGTCVAHGGIPWHEMWPGEQKQALFGTSGQALFFGGSSAAMYTPPRGPILPGNEADETEHRVRLI